MKNGPGRENIEFLGNRVCPAVMQAIVEQLGSA